MVLIICSQCRHDTVVIEVCMALEISKKDILLRLYGDLKTNFLLFTCFLEYQSQFNMSDAFFISNTFISNARLKLAKI